MKIVEDIAFGLLHLHQHSSAGIVHGNLKPSNVLLRPDCESSLTDYGLVPALLHSSPSASLLYRAPETRFASSAIGGFTAASDVYSFGVLLTGRTPFQELLQADDIPAWVRAARDEETAATESRGDLAARPRPMASAARRRSWTRWLQQKCRPAVTSKIMTKAGQKASVTGHVLWQQLHACSLQGRITIVRRRPRTGKIGFRRGSSSHCFSFRGSTGPAGHYRGFWFCDWFGNLNVYARALQEETLH
ncbi:hypothetical protein BRADI_2g24920v3 [Brachypodium distachyon]|uniref:Protein kinase domain-containing protein n=1 Tax=Brachypodium distachyon TaxID=15368 RepID=I1HJ92_BRADI|nr:hypothetical protein BRADI_2g24920v3 [Brachypodium distachyon]